MLCGESGNAHMEELFKRIAIVVGAFRELSFKRVQVIA